MSKGIVSGGIEFNRFPEIGATRGRVFVVAFQIREPMLEKEIHKTEWRGIVLDREIVFRGFPKFNGHSESPPYNAVEEIKNIEFDIRNNIYELFFRAVAVSGTPITFFKIVGNTGWFADIF